MLLAGFRHTKRHFAFLWAVQPLTLSRFSAYYACCRLPHGVLSYGGTFYRSARSGICAIHRRMKQLPLYLGFKCGEIPLPATDEYESRQSQKCFQRNHSFLCQTDSIKRIPFSCDLHFSGINRRSKNFQEK